MCLLGSSRAMFGPATAEPRSERGRSGADFRERGRARSWHGSLYRQRLGSGVPVSRIWSLTEGLQALRVKLSLSLAKVAPFSKIRFGSLADIVSGIRDVRFTSRSGYAHRRHQCLLCAKSGLGAPCHFCCRCSPLPKRRRQDRLIGTRPTSSVARAADEVVRPLPAEFTCLVLGELPGISEELRQGQ